MIQRIQSIFLLLASASVGLLYKFPFLRFGDDKEWIWEDKVSLIFTIAAAVLFFLTIFLFKNRAMQMRLNRVAIIFSLALIGYLVYWYFTGNQGAAKVELGAAFPILALVFGFLALRNIKKDDTLVKSVDRLR